MRRFVVRAAVGSRGMMGLVLVALLASSGCARWQRAEEAARTEAHHLELEGEKKQLATEEGELEAILAELHRVEAELEDMQRREDAGDEVPREARTALLERLSKLRERLEEERRREAERRD